jgi:hypothetical protein
MRFLCRIGWHDWGKPQFLGQGRRMWGDQYIGIYERYKCSCVKCGRNKLYTIED